MLLLDAAGVHILCVDPLQRVFSSDTCTYIYVKPYKNKKLHNYIIMTIYTLLSVWTLHHEHSQVLSVCVCILLGLCVCLTVTVIYAIISLVIIGLVIIGLILGTVSLLFIVLSGSITLLGLCPLGGWCIG